MFVQRTVALLVITVLALLIRMPVSAQATPPANRGAAPTYDLTDVDPEGDGIVLPGIRSGDIIIRHFDGFSQIEAGQYLVPSNLIYLDGNADNIIDTVPRYARVVVVMRDNLTYLFAPNTPELIGVFANGIGKGGANTVISVRSINVFLGASWGLEESIRENLETYPDGTMPNYFGDRTIGTQFFISDTLQIDTFQELHGTFRPRAGSVDGYNLLGTDISGGCVRHRNEDILFIAANTAVNDLVLSVETAQDDLIDNPLIIANRTRVAAGLNPIPLESGWTVEQGNILTRPANFSPVMPRELGGQGEIIVPTWMNFDQVDAHPSFTIPENLVFVEHPYTRGNYVQLTCGSETVFITGEITGQNFLIATEDGYRLNVAPVIRDANGLPVETATFYTPITVTTDYALMFAPLVSSGDPRAAVFQILVANYSYQYALYQMNTRWNFATPEETAIAVTQMDREQLRENQLVTGLIPLRYGDNGVYPTPVGEWIAPLSNRTVVSAMWNNFYGETGSVYMLDYREPLERQAIPHREMELSAPAVDNEFVATGQPGVSISSLLDTAWNTRQPVVFRVSKFRHLADGSYFLGMSAFHYYALVGWQSQTHGENIAVIYDTMHPYDLLYVPASQIAYVFTSMHIAPTR